MASDGQIVSQILLDLDTLEGQLQIAKNKFAKFADNNKKTTGLIDRNWKSLFTRISAGVIAYKLITGAVRFLKDQVVKTVQVFAEYENALITAAAKTGDAASDTVEFAAAYETLSDAAQRAGQNTIFTANQAAQALELFAASGFSADEAVRNLNGTLALAAATGADLVKTANGMTSVLSQFGKENVNADQIANVFAATITKTKATMDFLTQSFKFAGPVASALGMTVEDTAAAMGVLADAGFSGTMSGRALRGALNDLSKETGPTVRRLLSLSDKLKFSDIDPNRNNLIQILNNMKAAGIDSVDIFRSFTKEVGAQFLTLFKESEKLEALQDGITGTNKAYDLQERTLESLTNRYKLFISAVDALRISLMEKLAPGFKAVLAGATEVFRFLAGGTKVTDDLKAATDRLITSSRTYNDLTRRLTDGSKTLTAAEKDLIKTRREIAKLDAQQAAFDLVEAFNKQNQERAESVKQLKAVRGQIRTLTTDTDKLGMSESLRLKMLAEQQAALVQIRRADAERRATVKELIQTLGEAYAEGQIGLAQIAQIREKNSELADSVLAAAKAYEEQKKQQAELNSLYKTSIDDSKTLADIAADYKRRLDELTKSKKDNLKADRDLALSNASAYYDSTAVAEKIAFIKSLSEEQRKAFDEELKALEKQQSRYESAKKGIDAYFDALERTEKLDNFADKVNEISKALKDLAKFENSYFDKKFKNLDKEEEAELDRISHLKQSERERLEEALVNAQATGNQKLIDEAEYNLKSFDIKKEYERKRAELQYKADLSAWRSQLADIQVAGAIASINAWKALPNLPLAIAGQIAAGAATTVNSAIAFSNKPEKPSFETGGIVPGNSLTGDNIAANLNSREMVLTMDDQLDLLNKIRGLASGGSSGGQVVVEVHQDRRVVERYVVDGMKSGRVVVPKKAVSKV